MHEYRIPQTPESESLINPKRLLYVGTVLRGFDGVFDRVAHSALTEPLRCVVHGRIGRVRVEDVVPRWSVEHSLGPKLYAAVPKLIGTINSRILSQQRP